MLGGARATESRSTTTQPSGRTVGTTIRMPAIFTFQLRPSGRHRLQLSRRRSEREAKRRTDHRPHHLHFLDRLRLESVERCCQPCWSWMPQIGGEADRLLPRQHAIGVISQRRLDGRPHSQQERTVRPASGQCPALSSSTSPINRGDPAGDNWQRRRRKQRECQTDESPRSTPPTCLIYKWPASSRSGLLE